MTLRRARHRVTTLHCLFRCGHRTTVERIRRENDSENSYQDWSDKTHLNQIRRVSSASQAYGNSGIRRLPTSLRRSLTWDRGLEMAKHKIFTVATNMKVYFCDPTQPLAARNKRKHQPLAASILAEENGPFRLHTIPTGHDRPASKSTPEKNLRFRDSCE